MQIFFTGDFKSHYSTRVLIRWNKRCETCHLQASSSGPQVAGGGSPPAKKPLRRRTLFLDPGPSRKRVLELSTRWNFDLPLDSPADSLTVSQRQKAAVLALLLRDIKWFIFDEPTAVLTPEESENLFELFKRLRGEGRGIAFITHKLNEALAISDRLTIIRRGVTEKTRNTKKPLLKISKNPSLASRNFLLVKLPPHLPRYRKSLLLPVKKNLSF